MKNFLKKSIFKLEDIFLFIKKEDFFIKRDKLKEFDVCIRMIGDLSMMPNDLQQTMSKIMEITKQNKTLD